MTELEQLKATRALISDEAHFTTSEYARDEHGHVCDPRGPDACSWCVGGAWRRVTGAVDHLGLRRLCKVVAVTSVNDIQGHGAVLVMLDHAIERLTP